MMVVFPHPLAPTMIVSGKQKDITDKTELLIELLVDDEMRCEHH